MLKEFKGIALRELLMLCKSPRYFFFAFCQPLMAMLLFVPVMNKLLIDVKIGASYYVPYSLFILPGVLVFAALCNGEFVAMEIYNDKASGELELLLGMPMERRTLLMGKLFSTVLVTVIQCTIFSCLLVSVMDRVPIEPLGYAFLIVGVLVFACIIALLSIALTAVIKQKENFWVLLQFTTIPLVLMSTIFFPLKKLPGFLQVIVQFNPLTMITEFSRKMVFFMDARYLLVFILLFGFLVGAYFLAKNGLKKVLL